MAPSPELFELSDHLEIQALLNRFNLLFDEGDGEAVADLFAPGGELGSRDKTRGTREEMLAYVRDAATRPTHRHFTTNIVIEPVAGEPLRARAQACFLYMTLTPEGPQAQSFGTYADELVKQEGRWLFQRRLAIRAEPQTREAVQHDAEPDRSGKEHA